MDVEDFLPVVERAASALMFSISELDIVFLLKFIVNVGSLSPVDTIDLIFNQPLSIEH